MSDVHISSSCSTRTTRSLRGTMHHHVICVAQRRHLDETLMAREEDGKGEDRERSEGVVNRWSSSCFSISYTLLRCAVAFLDALHASTGWDVHMWWYISIVDNFVTSNRHFSFVLTWVINANYRMRRFVAGSVGYVPPASRFASEQMKSKQMYWMLGKNYVELYLIYERIK